MTHPPALHQVQDIMGMPIGIDVRDTDVDPAALDRAFAWLRWVDHTFSTYRADSEIMRINAGHLDPALAHPDVRAVLQQCEELRFATDGYFDIRAPILPNTGDAPSIPGRAGTIDPSGLVKGWSVDRAAQILAAAGARNYSINAGGDIRVQGSALPDTSWRVGIQHPLLPKQLAAVVTATDRAIATSGAYQRGQHIVDPHTGLPPEGVLSVTIVGPNLATADAFATAAFAMDLAGPDWTAGLPALGYEALTILATETVLTTPNFPRAS